MPDKPDPPRRDNDLLSLALKLIRRHRGLTALEMAQKMQMPLRTYERFEAGGSRLNIDYVHRFAAATDSDPYAIIMAVAIGSPELALRCADNKLVTTLTVGAQRFDQILGDRIQALEARAIIDAVCTMFDQLLIDSADQQRAAQWLERGVSDLSSIRPKPGR
ncbi:MULTISPECIES: helix-turn-helix domain-containing protein [Brevundimonas]|jgi:transcriptional regulator with XRE-family HTH domain|uniref:Transcriptional regulator with XRE-family HTH domain n=1 Tax=Brevundimonas aurantiaca TaxID=74316 RepID=A0A7W9C8U6_9CAUL|nr:MULTISPECIES: helix-turn-helix transcriptional regulator [Brevundimonas]MBB5740792.1 transcriptional regulator with XRE-family HTH domain [Brevundimonas aurantiaca]MDM8354285.1 helix-turn-helix transcriptional regulator [Brevundimonas diminuta]